MRVLSRAGGAEAERLDNRAFDLEAGRASGLGDGPARGRGMGFGDRITIAADHEGGRMAGPGMGAGDEGVEPFDLVRETVVDEKLQRPVGHGRLRSEAGLAQAVEHVIGPERAVLLKQDFQRLAPDGREA